MLIYLLFKVILGIDELGKEEIEDLVRWVICLRLKLSLKLNF